MDLRLHGMTTKISECGELEIILIFSSTDVLHIAIKDIQLANSHWLVEKLMNLINRDGIKVWVNENNLKTKSDNYYSFKNKYNVGVVIKTEAMKIDIPAVWMLHEY